MGNISSTRIKVKESNHVNPEKRMFAAESMFDSGVTVEKPKLKVVKTVEIGGKLFNVVEYV